LPARSRLRRGFTLLEVMTAVVILLILAALAVTFMVYGMGRARMNNTVFDVAALYNAAQLRALSSGAPHFILVHQAPDKRVRIHLLGRPGEDPAIDWATLDMNQEPEELLAYNVEDAAGNITSVNAKAYDRLVLGAGSGPDTSAGGIAFLDLDSSRVRKPMPAPFSAIALTTPMHTPSDVNMPTDALIAGCSFCIDNAGHTYGVIRFNPNGTVRMMTGPETGGVIAFAPNTADETGFTPKLLTLSAPAGATFVY
jgi:prepilin-type N-terminal cleavage/methylation domain-containing protein